jgi:hypothetical protein
VLWVRIGFNPDPGLGPELQVFRMLIRIQGFDGRNMQNFTVEKKSIFDQNLKYFILIPRPQSRMSKLREKPLALKREHPALQNKTFPHFALNGQILPTWIRIRPTKLMANPNIPNPQH